MTYDIAWSGSRERQGLCDGLSSYRGASQLVIGSLKSVKDVHARRLGKRAWHDTRALKKRGVIPPEAIPTPAQVKDRLRRGYSLRQTGRYFKVPVSVIRKQAAKAS